MDFRYQRPPPPPPSSMVDPHQHQQQPVPPPPGSWYSSSGQFQYHPSTQHSPPPPPPPPPHWSHPPHSDHLPPPPPYHAPLPPPYAANNHMMQQQHNHSYSLPPRPPGPPSHLHSQIPQPYPSVYQDWSNQSWGHHGWDYSVHNKEDDWAAKAKAWAAGKAETENHHQQSQFTLTPVGRLEELNHYHDQYIQNVDPHYADVQQQSHPASSYQQYPPLVAPSYRSPVAQMQETSSFSSGYVSDGHLPYSARDGTLAGDSASAFPHQETLPASLSVHRQEVPSSYSSVAGNEEAGQNGKFFESSHMPFASAPLQQMSQMSNIGRPVLMEQPHHAYGNQSAEPTADLSDQPLDFAPRFIRDHDQLLHSSYSNETGGLMRGIEGPPAQPSDYSWTPPAPGGAYSSMPQVDPSGGIPSPVPAHSATLFGRTPGPAFQSTMPSANPTFPIGTGNVYHATTAFPGDAYGSSGVPQHPKKASVPNWLREEIIKKKAVIGSSAQDLSKEDTKSNEDEGLDNSLGKGDQADSKSIESSRSTEEEDDDEDYVEAARTAAINQEIKRVLTEVLLKVTDELFDEIAAKVLSEDDLSVEVEHNTASNHTISPPTPGVPTPKASANVLIPVKTEELESDHGNGKRTSSSPGDVLGLGNYASDEDEDEETQNATMPALQQPTSNKLSEAKKPVENGSLQADTNERGKYVLKEESDPHTVSPTRAMTNHNAVGNELSHNRAAREVHTDIQPRYSSKGEYVASEDEIDDSNGRKVLDSSGVSYSNDSEKVVTRTKLPNLSLNIKKLVTEDSEGRTTGDEPNKNNRSDSKRSSASKESVKEVESVKNRTSRKRDETTRSQEEMHSRGQRKDERNGSKEKLKEQGVSSMEKTKDSDSRKRPHVDIKEDKKETERDRRSNTKEDNERQRERSKDEKGERSRHKHVSDSSRRKRRRSSSIGSRGRSNKDISTVSHPNDSSDESSDDSRRKVHSKQRNSSPSPVRSKRRQVSRSPHSKHSQRRHSPYSSIETTRRKRSRSRSPVRRQK